MKIHVQSYLRARLKTALRQIRRADELPPSSEKRLLEKELIVLLKTARDIFPRLNDGKCTLGEAIIALDEINVDTVCNMSLSLYSADSIGISDRLSSSDVASLLWQSRYAAATAAAEGRLSHETALKKLSELRDIPQKVLTERLDPLDRLYKEDEIYRLSDTETQDDYRRKTVIIGIATGVSSNRLGFEYMTMSKREQADDNKKRGETHVGAYISSDYRRVFPKAQIKTYALWLTVYSAIRTIASCFFTAWYVGLLSYFPFFAASKPFADWIVTHSVRSGGYLPRLSHGGKIPESGKTLCVMSALIPSEKSLLSAAKKLVCARVKNPCENLGFCLLCDLSPSETADSPSDNNIVKYAKEIAAQYNLLIIIRERRYSTTQRIFQGHERKRGAISELMGYISGEKPCFRAIAGDAEMASGVRYVCALDFDTMPFMDAIPELVAIAMHPLNKDFGIIAPRVTTSLSSSLKTLFSRIQAGIGGCSNVSSYDCASGELYHDFFGDATFCGKGLIDVKRFCEKCRDFFPEERILSHDVLEGGLLGTAYAGDVEFSDSFPDTSRGYFKRLHRWLRGDFQNARYIFDKRFPMMTRFKLADNFRRGITPIFTMALLFAAVYAKYSWGIVLLAIGSVVMPFLFGLIPCIIRGRGFTNHRKFYSPVLPETLQLLRQALMELLLLPKYALCSLDAITRTIWRCGVSKRHLLDWTTSELAVGGGFSHLIGAELLSLLLLILSVINVNIYTTIIAVFFLCLLPMMLFSDRKTENSEKINPAVKPACENGEFLSDEIQKMWRFYSDFVNADNRFLPPDNVQLSPVYRVARRTSPTNIGMYLLSVAAMRVLSLIDTNELERRVSDTLQTVESLKKWNGNLYNWYSTESLETLGGFVSSVDSGNFLCCLVAVKECLKAYGGAENLISRAEALLSNADLTPFYNKNRELFAVGYDTEKNEKNAKDALTPYCYDLLMSESRLMSYYAVARRMAPKRHWRALSREMGRLGSFAAPLAWTGTMFEYFMPELLLSSREGSVSYEALKFELAAQKSEAARLKIPFGKSESGYYAFDGELNYQYRAHGVPEAALKAGMERDEVISPYSSFLTLSLDPDASIANLKRLKKMGIYNGDRYGYFEAVDFTKRRTGSGFAPVKSYMAHHIGMALCGAANALTGGALQKLFAADSVMSGADELLEEHIIAGERLISPSEKVYEKEDGRMKRETRTDISVISPAVNPVCGGALTALCFDYGETVCLYGKKYAELHSDDILRHPRGGFFAVSEGEHVMPFYRHPLLKEEKGQEFSVEFGSNETVYRRSFRSLKLSMSVFTDRTKPVLYRSFTLENTSGVSRQLRLCGYMEPILCALRDYLAHPAFLDLFLSLSFDKENGIFLAERKERNTDKMTALAVGFIETEEFSELTEIVPALSREAVIKRGGGIFSALKYDPLKIDDGVNPMSPVPAPCIYFSSAITLAAKERKSFTLAAALGDSAEEALAALNELRRKKEKISPLPDGAVASPLITDTAYGRLVRMILPRIFGNPPISKERQNAINTLTLKKKALWRYSISGDRPLILFRFPEKSRSACGIDTALMAKKAMSLCGIDIDMAVVFRTQEQKKLIEDLTAEIGTDCAIIAADTLPKDVDNLLTALAVFSAEENALSEKYEPLPVKPLIRPAKLRGISGENSFTESGYEIRKNPPAPWCNIVANPQYGCLVSDLSLGFSWAINSRENKLSPWRNDLRGENDGEMLIARISKSYYSLTSGTTAFSPCAADYCGEAAGLSFKTSVRVFRRGMAKEITVTVENGTADEKKCEIAYYIEPILGDCRENSLVSVREENGVILVRNPLNDVVQGTMLIKGGTALAANRYAFLTGDWSGKPMPDSALRGIAAISEATVMPKKSKKLTFVLAFTENNSDPLGILSALKRNSAEPPEIILNCPKNFPATAFSEKNPFERDILYKKWLPWQIVGFRLWARTAFYQNGGAYGFRDQLQDAVAALSLEPKLCERQIYRACNSQFPEGDVLHWHFDFPPAKKGVRTRYTDDLLWLPYAISEYVRVTENKKPLKKEIAYIAGVPLSENEHEKYIDVKQTAVKENVYRHGKRSLEKAFRKGAHGLLLMGCGDWNDSYNNVGIEGRGESVWLTMFYILTARAYAEIARGENDGAYGEELEKRCAELISALDKSAWDGEYYLRAYYDCGEKMGSLESESCKIDILPQAFAALSELPNKERAEMAVRAAVRELVLPEAGIIRLFSPAFDGKGDLDPGYVKSYPCGVRENGGQYTHAAAWLAMACRSLGMDSECRQLTEMLMPYGRGAAYRNEPYLISADIYTNRLCIGHGGWSGYTGAAGWIFRLLSGDGESGI